MASIKAVLRKKENKKDGTFPLALRITKDRKSSFIHLGYQLMPDQWDDATSRVKKHPNAGRLNNLIIHKIAELTDHVIEHQAKKQRTSARAIKEKSDDVVRGNSFFKYAQDDYLKNLRDSGSFNRVSTEKPRIQRFKEFLSGDDIAFQDISAPLLRKFGAYLKRTRNVSDRTVINHFVVIRTIFNQAVHAGLVSMENYPFGKRGIQIKFPDSVKIGLTPEEVALLEHADLSEHPSQDHARNIWLISFYFAGMRISDVLRLTWSDIQDGRLYYTMGKNDKAGSIKVSLKAQRILDRYHGKEHLHDLVFPELSCVPNIKDKYETQRNIAQAISKINKLLKRVAVYIGIEKPLTMHIARHTFGNISGDRIPVQMLQKLYRHSHISTTVNYQSNFIFKDTDEALEKVIGG